MSDAGLGQIMRFSDARLGQIMRFNHAAAKAIGSRGMSDAPVMLCAVAASRETI